MRKQIDGFYYRAIVLKLYPTESKRMKLRALISRYRSVVNQFLKLFAGGLAPRLDKITLAAVESELSERYKSDALLQAIGIFKGHQNKQNNAIKKLQKRLKKRI